MQTILENGVVHNRKVNSTDLIGTIDNYGSKRLVSHCDESNVLTVITKYVVAPSTGLNYKSLYDYVDKLVKNHSKNFPTVVLFHSNKEGFEWLLD